MVCFLTFNLPRYVQCVASAVQNRVNVIPAVCHVGFPARKNRIYANDNINTITTVVV